MTVLTRVDPKLAAWMIVVGASGCAVSGPAWVASGTHGMVATDSTDASRAGLEILRAGGNAIDAATAVSFALGVTRPYSTGCGGGGFTIIRFADGRNVALDYRETAPRRSGPDMYIRAVKRNPDRRNPSRNGHLAVGVPGLVAGRCLALERYGKMSLERVLRPAVSLARGGFAIDQHYRDSSDQALAQLRADPSLRSSCAYVHRVHLNDGRLHSVGHVLRQPALARFLEQLAREGPDFFYRGAFGEALERTMIEHRGVLRADDLATYRVRERMPLVSSYRDYTVIAMPPPSSGGVALVQMLNTLARFDLEHSRREDPARTQHLIVEAMKHAYADRARWLADTDFVPVPTDLLTSRQYAAQLAARIEPDRVLNASAYGTSDVKSGAAALPDDAGTSHFCVVDRWGNVVVSTETINTSFGALVAVDEWGVILNNEMDDFTALPGERNAFGLIQSDRNAVEPGKRPLSSMSPTIILKDGEPYLMLGASGGPRIISSVLAVVLNVLDFALPIERAITTPRVHHQWTPDEVYFDRTALPDVVAGLESRGHVMSNDARGGVVQAILRTTTGWVGVSDPHKAGRPAGY